MPARGYVLYRSPFSEHYLADTLHDAIGLIEQRVCPNDADVFGNPSRLLSKCKGSVYVFRHIIKFPANLIEIIMRDMKPGR